MPPHCPDRCHYQGIKGALGIVVDTILSQPVHPPPNYLSKCYGRGEGRIHPHAHKPKWPPLTLPCKPKRLNIKRGDRLIASSHGGVADRTQLILDCYLPGDVLYYDAVVDGEVSCALFVFSAAPQLSEASLQLFYLILERAGTECKEKRCEVHNWTRTADKLRTSVANKPVYHVNI